MLKDGIEKRERWNSQCSGTKKARRRPEPFRIRSKKSETIREWKKGNTKIRGKIDCSEIHTSTNKSAFPRDDYRSRLLKICLRTYYFSLNWILYRQSPLNLDRPRRTIVRKWQFPIVPIHTLLLETVCLSLTLVQTAMFKLPMFVVGTNRYQRQI